MNNGTRILLKYIVGVPAHIITLHSIWEWFFVPHGAIALSYLQIFLLRGLIRMCVTNTNDVRKVVYQGTGEDEDNAVIIVYILAPALVFLLAYGVKTYFPGVI